MKKSYSIRIWVIALVALMIAAYTFSIKNKAQVTNPPLQKNTTQGTSQGTTQAEKIMAPDFTLKYLDGKSVKLSDYKDKIVILNFWAVWCKCCKQEMPDLNELNKELEKDNEAVILAVDVKESADTVNEYLTPNNISLKVLLDSDGSIAEMYGITGYPTTFVLNKDGSVYTYIPQATDKATLLTIIDKIKKGESLHYPGSEILPITVFLFAPVAAGTLLQLPLRVSFASMANAAASFASLLKLSSSCVVTNIPSFAISFLMNFIITGL